MDAETLCRLAWSCEEARQLDATHYDGVVRAKLGFVTIRARVGGEVLESDEPRAMTVALRGESIGLPGSFEGLAHLTLTDTEGTTQGQYAFDVDILGRLGSLGKPFFQMTAQRMAGTFARKVSRFLARDDT